MTPRLIRTINLLFPFSFWAIYLFFWPITDNESLFGYFPWLACIFNLYLLLYAYRADQHMLPNLEFRLTAFVVVMVLLGLMPQFKSYFINTLAYIICFSAMAGLTFDFYWKVVQRRWVDDLIWPRWPVGHFFLPIVIFILLFVPIFITTTWAFWLSVILLVPVLIYAGLGMEESALFIGLSFAGYFLSAYSYYHAGFGMMAPTKAIQDVGLHSAVIFTGIFVASGIVTFLRRMMTHKAAKG